MPNVILIAVGVAVLLIMFTQLIRVANYCADRDSCGLVILAAYVVVMSLAGTIPLTIVLTRVGIQ